MALTADVQISTAGADTLAYPVLSGATIYAGGVVAVGTPTHPTAGRRGRAFAWTGAAGERIVGLSISGGVNNAGVVGIVAETVEVSVTPLGQVAKRITVTGVTTLAGVGEPVFAADDDIQTVTLTRPARGVAIGKVTRYYTGSICDVYLYSHAELDAIAGVGQRYVMLLGHFDADTMATGNLRTSMVTPHAGRFISLHAVVDVPIAGAGGTTNINLEIGGTNVTGGVVTVSTAAGGTKGTVLNGTAITAANVFSEGSLLDIEATTGVDATGGSFDLYALVERLAGA